MKPHEIQELIDFISKSGLDEVNIETSDFKIAVKKHSGMVSSPEARPAAAPQPAAAQLPAGAPAPQAPAPAPSEAPKASAPEAGKNYLEVRSPMIGTFYRSPNPDSPSFVQVGDTIKKGQTVCIIEAMKLFNEIESEVSGTIVKILVENATPVEYDQPLFLVDPS